MTNLHAPWTIGDVASRAGVRAATLREWERRHGFPRPERLPSGHRRYTDEHVAQVRDVLARQRAGMSLAAAIRELAGEHPPEASLYASAAAVSRRGPIRSSRRTMLAISRAIEDACAAAGDRSILLGAFQYESIFRRSEIRWRELARSAAACVVLADFADRREHHGLVEVPVGDSSPLLREWAVAVAGPRLRACLVGWEWRGGADHHFEALWSVEPEVVDAVLTRGLAAAGRHYAPPLAAGDDALDQAMAVMDRILTRIAGP